MHYEAFSETFNPAQTGGIVVDAIKLCLPFAIYT